jgi:hypothetical protein
MLHPVDFTEFLHDIAAFLAGYYLALSVMNGVAAGYLWRTGKATTYLRRGRLAISSAGLSAAAAVGFLVLAAIAFTGDPGPMRLISLPQSVKDWINYALNPTRYMLGTAVGLVLAFLGRRFFVKPAVAWTAWNLSLLLLGLSLTDHHFASIVGQPDNVPIVGMVFLLGFFTWLGAWRAVTNDERIARGEPPQEAVDYEKVLVWPDLVYIELITMVAATTLLLLWSIGVKAPLEAPANALETPNPSKAPWYFVGLQEMLVYFDPWMAGVVLPGLIIFGLLALPYLDRNPRGNGYYTISQRKFAYLTFQFGFLVLWITLIVLGTFLRGPKWDFFGPYEPWTTHKVVVARNVDLARYFWVEWLGRARPLAPEGARGLTRLLYILLREAPGFVVLGIYFVVAPRLLAKCSKTFRKMRAALGHVRYRVLLLLFLTMLLLPIKMLARWSADLSYFVSIPEYYLNF